MIRRLTLGLILVAGLLVALAPPSLRAQAKGKRYAIVVGVNEYENRNLDELRFAEADAKDLAAVLTKSGYDVRLLLGSADGAARATAKNVRAAFDTMLAGVTKADTVLVGLSGHGVQLFVDEGGAKKEIPFFCARDAKPTDGATMVSLSDMLRKLDADGGGHNLLLVDACRNVVDPNKGKRGIEGSRVKDLGVNTVAFFSCGSRQMSRETEKAGGGHGVFFHYVLEGLKGGAKDGRNRVTFDRLKTYVTENVGESVEEWFADMKASERQRPVAMGNFEGSVVLAETGAIIEHEVEIVKGVKMMFCWVPAGKAWLGSPVDEKGRFPIEKEPWEYASKGFWMGKYEVTQAQYAAVVGKNPSRYQQSDDLFGGNFKGVDTTQFPVTFVDWDDTQNFLKLLDGTKSLGRGSFGLPFQDEWEYAARAGTRTAFSFGDSEAELGDYAWYKGNSDNKLLSQHSVGLKLPNSWGLYDMHGGVSEWCQDFFDEQPKKHGVCGGSWSDEPASCRSAARSKMDYTERTRGICLNLGFRLVFRPKQ